MRSESVISLGFWSRYFSYFFSFPLVFVSFFFSTVILSLFFPFFSYLQILFHPFAILFPPWYQRFPFNFIICIFFPLRQVFSLLFSSHRLYPVAFRWKRVFSRRLFILFSDESGDIEAFFLSFSFLYLFSLFLSSFIPLSRSFLKEMQIDWPLSREVLLSTIPTLEERRKKKKKSQKR